MAILYKDVPILIQKPYRHSNVESVQPVGVLAPGGNDEAHTLLYLVQ